MLQPQTTPNWVSTLGRDETVIYWKGRSQSTNPCFGLFIHFILWAIVKSDDAEFLKNYLYDKGCQGKLRKYSKMLYTKEFAFFSSNPMMGLFCSLLYKGGNWDSASLINQLSYTASEWQPGFSSRFLWPCLVFPPKHSAAHVVYSGISECLQKFLS